MTATTSTFSDYQKQSSTIKAADGDDTITVTTTGTVITTGVQPTFDLTVAANADHNTVTVSGTVGNTDAAAIKSSGFGTFGPTITVNPGGAIVGATLAIDIAGGTLNTVTNNGVILGGTSAIRISSGTGSITNNSTGLISGPDRAIEIFSGTITNSGTIAGSIVFSAPIANKVTNSGLILGSAEGAIVFGIGNDRLESQNGTVVGTVFGGDGNDTLLLGFGDNTINGGDGADVLDGGDGIDFASYAGATLGVTANLANSKLNLGDALGDVYKNIEGLIGSDGNDKLTGNKGANTLDGGDGVDTLAGGAGDDTYYVDNSLDVVIEAARGGTDTVYTTGSYTLNAQQIEILSVLDITTTNALDLTGSNIANQLIGNDGKNVLNGGAGADTMSGGGGNDTLIGGLGNDVLTGSEGADAFVFDTKLGKANVDTIMDFSHTEGDQIRLFHSVFANLAQAGSLDADELQVGAGAAASSPTTRIIYDTSTGSLYYDPDGKGGKAAIKFAVLLNKPATLAVDDFSVMDF